MGYSLELGAKALLLLREYCDYHSISYTIKDKGPDKFFFDVETEEIKDQLISILE